MITIRNIVLLTRRSSFAAPLEITASGYDFSTIVARVYLDKLVPASRDDDGSLGKGRESDAGNPLGVAVLLDGELADTDGVPELDGSVSGGREDLSVVGREGDREDVLGVADESSDGVTAGEVPKSEGGVPGAGEGVLTVGADLDVGDEVGVTLELVFIRVLGY